MKAWQLRELVNQARRHVMERMLTALSDSAAKRWCEAYLRLTRYALKIQWS